MQPCDENGADCRAQVDSERRFLDDVNAAGPLYSAPPPLRSRVERILRDAPGNATPRHRWAHRGRLSKVC